MRRGSLLQLVVIAALVSGAAVAVALVVPWLPTSASKERDRIDVVFWVATAICIAVFVVVFSVSAYALWKFRAPPDDDSDGPPIHGHTGIEITWTAIPAVLVTAIAAVSAVVLAENGHVPKHHLTVDVTARQFAWSFSYPGYNNLSSAMLRLPVHEPVLLRISSLDVIHSFWVPQFGQKQDALPKPQVTKLVITPTKTGKFPVICTELCGAGHAFMRSYAIVMTKSAFTTWAQGGKKSITGPPGKAGATVFQEQGCGSCHAFKAAGATAKVGPDLDKLPQYARQAGKPLDQFVRQSIVDPNAYVQKGYPPNVMPQTFGSLPKQQLDALVQYLVGGSK